MKIEITDKHLDAMRLLGDPLADAVIAALPDKVWDNKDILPIIDERGRSDKSGPFYEFYNHIMTVPDWVNPEKMQIAAQVGIQYAPLSGLILTTASLVESYSAAKGAKVLMRTGRLKKDVINRLFETAKFAHDIGISKFPGPGTSAHATIIRVRLLHAMVRKFTLKTEKPSPWKDEWGTPINQEDYAMTLLMFSHVYTRSIHKLGVRLTPHEIESIQHVWRYTGYLLGVDESLLCESAADEEKLYSIIARRQFHPDEDSVALSHGVLDALNNYPPFYIPSPILYQISRFLIGDRLADAMQFPPAWPSIWITPLLAVIAVITRTQDLLPWGKSTALAFGKWFTGNTLDNAFKAKPASFTFRSM